MNRDVLYVLKVTRPRAADSPGGRPVRAVGAVALFATGIWWVILHYGSRGIGWPIDDMALLLPLGGIFLILLLVLGLGMTASDAPNVRRNRRQGGVTSLRLEGWEVICWAASARASETPASRERPENLP
jgi:hypothetical protein